MNATLFLQPAVLFITFKPNGPRLIEFGLFEMLYCKYFQWLAFKRISFDSRVSHFTNTSSDVLAQIYLIIYNIRMSFQCS